MKTKIDELDGVIIIYVPTDKKKEPKMMEGTDAIYLLVSESLEEGDGRAKGNNKKVDDEIIKQIIDYKKDGLSVDEIAARTGISRATIYALLPPELKKKTESKTTKKADVKPEPETEHCIICKKDWKKQYMMKETFDNDEDGISGKVCKQCYKKLEAEGEIEE